jgi:hypothetical protein
MSEKRLTRSSISASTSNESTSSSVSSKKESLNSIKEEAIQAKTSASKEEVASTQPPTASNVVATRKSLRRSEASSTTTTPTLTQVVTNPEISATAATNNLSSSDLSATESTENKRSKRIRDQKSVSSSNLISQKPVVAAVEPKNIKEEVKNSVKSEQPPVIEVRKPSTEATDEAKELISATLTASQPDAGSNSKIITRRRSSNLMNQLRSGSSSSLLSQSLNLGKSKLFLLKKDPNMLI